MIIDVERNEEKTKRDRKRGERRVEQHQPLVQVGSAQDEQKKIEEDGKEEK